MKSRLFALLLLAASLAFGPAALAFDPNDYVPARHKDPGSDDFGWFLAPTPVNLEGVGSAVPVFGLLANGYQGADLIGVTTLPGGDFAVNVAVLDEFPLLWGFQFTGGIFSIDAAYNLYNRGIDSNPDDYVVPYFHQAADFWDLRYVGWEQRIEIFYRDMKGSGEQIKVLDAKGNTISDQKSKNSFTGQQYGFQFDLTDDRVDPRRGTRFGQKSKPMESDTAFTSDLLVTDQEINFYIPMDHVDTLVVNAFRSRSSITRAGVTDEASARAALSQGCVKGAAGYAACKAAEDKIVNDALAYNRYGATSLGGSDRLRGYDMGRFTAGNADFYGVEYRWNFADEAKPVNWYVIGGVNTLVQLAIFAETGSVADKTADLSNQYKSDVGVGIRAIISGFVYRLDLAMGDEGLGVTMFIDYPMQLLPVME